MELQQLIKRIVDIMSLMKRIKSILKNSQYADIEQLRKIGIKIGQKCEIYSDVSFGSEPYLISIGDHVRITQGVRFVTHDGGVWVVRELYKEHDIDLFGNIEIGNNVHIGLNTIIMPGVKIGSNVIIGCGAVVTKSIPDGEIWGGVPAKKITTVEEYYSKHTQDFDHTKNMDIVSKETYLRKKFEKDN